MAAESYPSFWYGLVPVSIPQGGHRGVPQGARELGHWFSEEQLVVACLLLPGAHFNIKNIFPGIGIPIMRHVTLVAITGTLVSYLLSQGTETHLKIGYSERFPLQASKLQMSCRDLIARQGLRIVVSAMATRGTFYQYGLTLIPPWITGFSRTKIEKVALQHTRRPDFANFANTRNQGNYSYSVICSE